LIGCDLCESGRRALHLAGDEDAAVPTFRSPAIDRTEGRRAERLARAQAEAGVVPRAADRIALYQALAQGSVIMGAGAADGEHLVSGTDENYGFLADMAFENLTVTKRFNRDALRQIGPRWLGRFPTHGSIFLG
jgi:hypothetical protein